jgi:signal transduction histidine kinase
MNPMTKILVIDDEPGIREGCKRALTPQGFSVDAAENGEDGLRLMQASSYDLVLLDVMMPGISGMDVLGAIHAHDPEIICIIITGFATVELAVSAIKQGAYDFLTKPFASDDLMLVVNRGLERRRLSLEAKRLQTIEAEAKRLAEEKARLEELDKAKLAFIRLVTHELQAPVAAIQSYLELILESYIPPEKQRDILQKAMARAQEQVALLTDLLEFGRLRTVKPPTLPVPVQVDAMLRQVVGQLEAQAIQKNIHFEVSIAAPLPPVRVLPDQMKSVWTNLISNAIKYTPEGGAIEIVLRESDGQLVGQVRDTGIGIPPEAQPQLFTEFFRADNAKTFSPHGTGLGLTIVKQIVENAGGAIQVESQVGQGSTFTIKLPASDR